MAEARFDIKTKQRIYPNLPIEIVNKYIESGRFVANDLISESGQNDWQELLQHRLFAEVFGATLESEMEFEIQLPGQLIQSVSSEDIALMIDQGNLKEAHRVRLPGDEQWQLAGDVEELHKHFSFRWNQESQTGGATKKRSVEIGIPFYQDFGAVFTFFNHPSFFYNFAAILICMMIFDLPFLAIFGIIITLWVYSYGFRLLDKVSEGAVHFPEWGNSSDILGQLVSPMIRMLLAHLIGLFPLILSMQNLPEVALVIIMPFSVLFFRLFDPVAWLGLLLFSLYYPIAVTRMAAYDEFLPPINVISLFRSISRATNPYLMLVGIGITLDISVVIVGIILQLISAGIAMTPIGYLATYLGNYLVKGLNLVGFFVKMYLMGRFLYQNRVRMGWD